MIKNKSGNTFLIKIVHGPKQNCTPIPTPEPVEAGVGFGDNGVAKKMRSVF